MMNTVNLHGETHNSSLSPDWAEVYEWLHPQTEPSVILLGDGSGSTWAKSCGWAVFVVDLKNSFELTICGSSSMGSVNYSELYPYVHALLALHDYWHRKELLPTRRIDIISDSEVTVRCGNGLNERRAHGGLWASIAHYETLHKIFWHHVGRNSFALSKVADKLSKNCRKGVQTCPK